MKPTHILAICALALGSCLPVAASAQNAVAPNNTATSATPASLTDGEVKKIDPGTGKVTIKHGDIQHLDMPGMSMVFTARDKALLTPLKVGDKIRFMATEESGKLIITEIQPMTR